MDKILEVTNNAEMEAVNTHQPFIRTTFRPVTFAPNGKTIATGVASAARLFNPGKEPNLGDLFMGEIKQFETTDYQIDGKTVNKVTVAAMQDENPIEIANALLARNKACVIVNGKNTLDLKKVFAATPAEEEETA